MKKLRKVLKDKSGASIIMGSFVALAIFVGSCFLWEYLHLKAVSIGIRDAFQNAVTTVCTENYSNVYNGIREGYTGAYQLQGSNWEENIDSGDIASKLDNLLGTQQVGSEHVKYVSGKEIYSFSDLSIQFSDTPLAPDDSGSAQTFTAVGYVTLSVPLEFGWGHLPPMTPRIKVTAGYSAKY